MTVLKLLLPTSFLLSATSGAADGVNTAALNAHRHPTRARTARQQREGKLECQADGGVFAAPRVFPHINVDRCNFSHRQRSNFSLHSITAAPAARFLRSRSLHRGFFCFAAQPEIAPINQLFYGNELMPRGNHATFYRFFALKLCVLASHELCQWTLQRALISIAGRFALSIYAPLSAAAIK